MRMVNVHVAEDNRKQLVLLHIHLFATQWIVGIVEGICAQSSWSICMYMVICNVKNV